MKTNQVVHFEFPAKDRKRISNFYSKAFGWKIQMLGEDMDNYVLATTTEGDEKTGRPKNPGAINGGFYEKLNDKEHLGPSVVISVEDIEESMKKIKASGGKIIGEPIEIKGYGMHVSFIDTEGNRNSIMQPLDKWLKDNKENGIIIERVFDLSKEQVWKAWTEPERVKKWWGPEGFTAPSIKIDLKEGRKYIFAMQGPKGSKWDKVMYSAGIYKEIIPYEKLILTDYFSDEKGNKIEPKVLGMDPNFPKELILTVLFKELEKNKTKLSIIYSKPKSKEEMEAIKKSKMDEGWNSSLNKLEKSFLR